MRNKRLIILLSVVGALVIFIIACGATFLVRDIEAYSYYENSPVEYDQKVIEVSGIKPNSSMFFIDEKSVKESVEKQFYNISVINVERKFPDRVSVNYVVYGSAFQYLSGDKYYTCYSSGRIGGVSDNPVGGYFIVKPKSETSQTLGEYFQNVDGYDRKLLNEFIDYLHSAALNDKQIAERIDFVDLTRDGYFYIRTKAGCSIEIHGVGEEFEKLLDGGWSAFTDPSPDKPISVASGTIRVYLEKSDPQNPKLNVVYNPTDGDAYYSEKYVSGSAK